jgi:hypothetical protein
MSASRSATGQAAGAHVCRSCTLPLVQPQDAERTGRDWLVELHCPSCDWSGEALLDQAQMDDLDEALDDGFALLAAALDEGYGRPGRQTKRYLSPLTQRDAVPETPRILTLFDSLGRPRSAITSSSLMPSCTLR